MFLSRSEKASSNTFRKIQLSKLENQQSVPENQLSEPKMSNQAIERLTSVLLDAKNYNIWARQVSFGLVSRDKLE
jgi:hypothetical protein